MEHVRPCECLAMLLADKVIREERTHKVYILGTFSNIVAAKFPTVHDTLHVYLALTEANPGQHEGKLQIVYIDEGPYMEEKELLHLQGPVAVKDKLEVLELNMELRHVALPKPGTLDVRFHFDGVYINSRRLKVIHAPPPAKPPAESPP